MQISITWNAVVGICTLVALIGTVLLWGCKMMIQSELGKFLVQLNGTYVRTHLFTAEIAEFRRRLDKLENPLETAIERSIERRLGHLEGKG